MPGQTAQRSSVHETGELQCFLVGKLPGVDGSDHGAHYRLKSRVHQRWRLRGTFYRFLAELWSRASSLLVV